MDAIKSDTDLVRWDVPFADWLMMSVNNVIAEPNSGRFMIVVGRSAGDDYPKYLVQFEKTIAFWTYEEFPSDFGVRFSSLTGFVRGLKAYQWVGSPQAQSWRGFATFMRWPEPRHYLILGGDSIIEVISSHEPKVERVDAKRFIEVRYEV